MFIKASLTRPCLLLRFLQDRKLRNEDRTISIRKTAVNLLIKLFTGLNVKHVNLLQGSQAPSLIGAACKNQVHQAKHLLNLKNLAAAAQRDHRQTDCNRTPSWPSLFCASSVAQGSMLKLKSTRMSNATFQSIIKTGHKSHHSHHSNGGLSPSSSRDPHFCPAFQCCQPHQFLTQWKISITPITPIPNCTLPLSHLQTLVFCFYSQRSLFANCFRLNWIHIHGQHKVFPACTVR